MHLATGPLGPAARTPRWTAPLFALAMMAIGLLPGWLTFALDPHTPTRIGLGVVPVPAWVFTLVWVVAYPCMGVATWLVWRRRGEVDVAVPLAIFAAALVQTFSFWFTQSVQMTAVLDAIGVLLAYTVAWVYARYAPVAVWWLLPWLLWMPITLAIKLWVVFGGAG